MSRPLRAEFPGAIWHVTSRGNERQAVFFDDADRELFLDVLGATVRLFGWRLHAFVLMGNHYHLVVETPDPTLSRGMRQLNGVFTQAFNRRHGRAGHLFQGRYKAILVERETHLLALLRYVVRNPVRAGITRRARDWAWGSYRATAGLAPRPDWLETAWTVEQFGRGEAEARRRYREFVEGPGGDDYRPWQQVQGQIYLGAEAFAKEASRRGARLKGAGGIPRSQREPALPSLHEVVAQVEERLGTTLEQLRGRPRLLAREREELARALRHEARAKLADIAALLGVGIARASALAVPERAERGTRRGSEGEPARSRRRAKP